MWLAVLSLLAAGALTGVAQAAGPEAARCTGRALVLSAMPVELGPLLARTEEVHTVSVDGHDFYLGRLQGRDVTLALTGIGPVNAGRVTHTALSAFRCGPHPGITEVVFSGVAGGDFIGDVVVPSRWTLDDGRHFVAADPGLLARARRVSTDPPPLRQDAPLGDPGCTCAINPDVVSTVRVTHAPVVEVGGDGQTTDPFSGRALPCVPGGGDVFGCEPCPEQKKLARDAEQFVPGIVPFADPAFFTGYFATSSQDASRYVVEDEETAAVASAAHAAGVPFIGFRGVSDGGGDPLGLPGFPVQFFYYRQLAADNAAAVTTAFLSGP
jgi:nucleoside phosphorylase